MIRAVLHYKKAEYIVLVRKINCLAHSVVCLNCNIESRTE